jgi:aminodeoxyfutalosine synthase
VAQSYGADDIDGTVVHEKIYHAAGSDSPQALTVADLRRLIEEAGRTPVERDTLYNEVIRDVPTQRDWAVGRKLVSLA